MSDFTIACQTLVLSTGWDTQAQYNAIYNRLSEEIKDEFSSRELLGTFEELVNLAICVDNHFCQCCRECDRE